MTTKYRDTPTYKKWDEEDVAWNVAPWNRFGEPEARLVTYAKAGAIGVTILGANALAARMIQGKKANRGITGYDLVKSGAALAASGGILGAVEGATVGRAVWKRTHDAALAKDVGIRRGLLAFVLVWPMILGALLAVFSPVAFACSFFGLCTLDPALTGIAALVGVCMLLVAAALLVPCWWVLRESRLMKLTGNATPADYLRHGYVAYGPEPWAWIKPDDGLTDDQARTLAQAEVIEFWS